MKKRNLSFITAIAMFVIITLLTACGGKSTSAQEPADQQKPTQEASNQADQQETTKPAEQQETTEPADQQETTEPATQEKPVTNQEVATSDVKHWKVEDGKLMGQTGAEEFVCFASFPESSGINDNAVVEDSDGENLLIKQEAAFYSFDLKTNEIKLITDGAIDSFFDPYERSVYFYTTDHNEYVISDWKQPDATETGKQVDNYYKFPSNSFIEGFDEFSEIQELAKNGDTKAIFDKGIVIDEKGNLYDFNNNEICNVHLPSAMVGNVFATKDAACLIEDTKMTVYRYGEAIFEADLGEGHWIPICVYSDPVVNGIFYNFDNREIWKIDSSGYKIPISEEVEVGDFVAHGDMLFYCDKDGAGYTNGWNIAPANMKACDKCLGVSRYSEFKGFIMPEKGGVVHNGLQIFVF